MHVPDSCAPGAPRLPGAPSPPWSPIPSLEPAPAICAVTNTTNSQSPSPPLPRLRRRMKCERVTAFLSSAYSPALRVPRWHSCFYI
eukprot:scaffold14274_cov65-Phaeocystis_antarctica.AAC.8